MHPQKWSDILKNKCQKHWFDNSFFWIYLNLNLNERNVRNDSKNIINN